MSEMTRQQQYLGVFQGGQGTIGDLKIGASDFGVEEYVDQDQVTRSGLTCGLWFFVRNRDDLNRSQRVYPGAVIAIAGYEVHVDYVEEGEDQAKYVLLTVLWP